MSDRGKIDRAFFAERIAPRLGAERDDVALGPTAGVDFGLLEFDGTGLAVATDPISVLPALGFERAGRFALHVALSDVAVAGVAPSHLAISFSLPESISDAEFDALWTGIHEECAALGRASSPATPRATPAPSSRGSAPRRRWASVTPWRSCGRTARARATACS
ncbi:thiamine monophosphate kinase [Halolamina pelagica]|uniref:Thiamine monophosphate kinase n=1 Tax=Halolamina pelagica TaxID=699431 RepID=A0A0P7HD44_9EURY|nr:AIR synthase related protein [Halolamina pelagica]KPN31520.1 thiamine monophosphate kinase [Halolamina pelagica]